MISPFPLFEGPRALDGGQLLGRIVSDRRILAGKAVIKGTRLSVDYIWDLLAHGSTTKEILDECDALAPEDIRTCLRFASAT